MPAATRLRMMVVVSGRWNARPNSVKFRSPGRRPKPIFLNQGVQALMISNAMKMTMSQRNMRKKKGGGLSQPGMSGFFENHAFF